MPSHVEAKSRFDMATRNLVRLQPLSPVLHRGGLGLGLGGFLGALLVSLRALGGTLNFQNFFLGLP